MANAMGQGNYGRPGTAGTSSAGQNFISTLIARMPYTYKVIQNAIEQNPKYELFDRLQTDPARRLSQQSVFQNQPETGAGQIMIDKRYHQFMYADVDVDKVRRVQEYRSMAAYAELADAIEEIADETIVKDENDQIVTLTVRGDYDKAIVDGLEAEWQRFIQIFQLEEKGWEMVCKFLIEGELFFENVISEKRPDHGILGLVSVPTELINPIYDNVQNQLIEGFLLRKPIIDPKKTMTNQSREELIVFDINQVTYIHSGIWNEDHTIRIPYIEKARRAYKQLSLVEDSIIIYRLVRAPERLVFKVDVGNMAVPKAEEYIRKLMQQYWTKKNFDSSQSRVTNIYDPQSMLDAYWFPKRGQSEGTTVEQLAGGANLGQLDDLMYFVRKLYKSLKVPQQRLEADNPFQDGEQITREELRFARFIIRLQQRIAHGIKQSFISHLKLREKRKDDPDSESIWERFELREHDIYIEFNMPTSFAVMREQQIFDLKKNNFTGVAATELMSQSFCQKTYLGLTPEQMAENREWLRKDAALSWEVQQIIASGPNFREKLKMEQEMMAQDIGGGIGGIAPGGGSALPGGGEFNPEMPPEFGPAPETPEGAQQAAAAGQQQQPAASNLPPQ